MLSAYYKKLKYLIIVLWCLLGCYSIYWEYYRCTTDKIIDYTCIFMIFVISPFVMVFLFKVLKLVNKEH